VEQHPERIARDLTAAALRSELPVTWYCIGDGWLGLQSTHQGFLSRFKALFGACVVPGGPEGRRVDPLCVTVRHRGRPPAVLATVDGDPDTDLVALALRAFPERHWAATPVGSGPWTAIGSTNGGPEAWISGNLVVAVDPGRWKSLVGSLVFSRLVQRQKETVFLHAASLAAGEAGLLLAGPKGAGKTTMALAWAARGHGFLGDEIAAVRPKTLELLPVPRSASMRAGPGSLVVAERVRVGRWSSERFPDGEMRTRIAVGRMFPGTLRRRPVALRAMVTLRGFDSRAKIEQLDPGPAVLRGLTPLGATMWDASTPLRAMRLLALASRVRCYALTVGPVEQTVDLLEQIGTM